HEIAAYFGDVGVDQAFRDRTGRAAVAHLGAIEAAHAGNAETGGRKEHLVRVRRVEEIDVALHYRNTELICEIQRHLAADALKDVALTWGIELAVADDEYIAAHSLGEIAIYVEQHRPTLRIVRLHGLLRDDHIQVIVRFRTRAEHVGRDAALGGSPHVE